MFEHWHAFKAGTITRDQLRSFMTPVRARFKDVLMRAAAASIDRLSGSCANILAGCGCHPDPRAARAAIADVHRSALSGPRMLNSARMLILRPEGPPVSSPRQDLGSSAPEAGAQDRIHPLGNPLELAAPRVSSPEEVRPRRANSRRGG